MEEDKGKAPATQLHLHMDRECLQHAVSLTPLCGSVAVLPIVSQLARLLMLGACQNYSPAPFTNIQIFINVAR